ncbi:hypothetical protein AB3N60_19125 (plasmid) [Leptospira sp. WS39.C2]
MPSIRITKAKKEDDAELVQFTASFASEGNLKLALDRSPSFFESLSKEGENPEIIIGRDSDTDQIIGAGYRIESDYIFQSKRMTLGYLAGLRLLKEYRSGIALARGYKKLKELHQKSKSKGYFTTIQTENLNALQILSSHRAGLPFYQFVTHLTTFIWNPNSFKKKTNLIFEPVTNSRQFKTYVEQMERKSYLRPHWDDSFYEKKEITKFVIKDQNKVIVCFSIWDQNATKRWKVIGYSHKLNFFRYFYNIYAKLRKLPILPIPGSQLHYNFLTQLCIDDKYQNRLPEIFSVILNSSSHHYKGSYLCFTLSNEDPWYHSVKKIPAWEINSMAYFVHWDPTENLFQNKLNGFSVWEAALL